VRGALDGSLAEHVLADPGVHRDGGRRAGIDGPGGPKLRDGEHDLARLAGVVGKSGPFLAEQQDAGAGQRVGLERYGTGQVVDADDGKLPLIGPAREGTDVPVITQVLVAVGDHCAPAVPAPPTDDVHLAGEKRVRRTDNRADIEIVLPVFDGDVEVVSTGVLVRHDRLVPPVAVPVDDVAYVAMRHQLRVVPGILRPGLRQGANTDRQLVDLG
jgi:hypothetical protein